MFISLQCSVQCDRQLLIDLMDCRLDFHLEAPLSSFDTILKNRTHFFSMLKDTESMIVITSIKKMYVCINL